MQIQNFSKISTYILVFSFFTLYWGGVLSWASNVQSSALTPELLSSLDVLNRACGRPARLRLSDSQALQLASAAKEAGEKYNVDFRLIFAVMAVESNCMISAKSKRGARGLMQLLPPTATWLGVNNIFHARENILGGTKYLSLMLKEFDGNLDLALAAYNAGPSKVKRYKRIPPYKETKFYVKKVLTRYSELV